jgi:hypothetical protein
MPGMAQDPATEETKREHNPGSKETAGASGNNKLTG